MSVPERTLTSPLRDSRPLSALTRPELREAWRLALTNGRDADPSETVIQELSEYFQMVPNDVRRRCEHWEDESVKEWQAADRSTPAGLLNFYQTQTSWIFDTMWYHAEQYHERIWAESIEIMHGLAQQNPSLQPGHHLDFGAGPGSSSLFFHQLGWETSLADISTTMLDFARWRFAKHGVPAAFYDTAKDSLPTERFHLITAFDVMVHVPNIAETLETLNRALRPGGYLIFNIDNLPKTEKTEWHLYTDQYPILRQVRRAGFRRLPKIIFFHVFQKTEYTDRQRQRVDVADQLRYNAAMAAVGKLARRLKLRRQL